MENQQYKHYRSLFVLIFPNGWSFKSIDHKTRMKIQLCRMEFLRKLQVLNFKFPTEVTSNSACQTLSEVRGTLIKIYIINTYTSSLERETCGRLWLFGIKRYEI